ncbi:MAG: hypothetical protein KAS90_05870 [Candidatus Aenigmarchaeota archaeon]|nr:hypothetical protein [Candidatus Aenigmarchaeota archaeon]
MASDTQRWVDEKIKAGYDTDNIRTVLVKNGFDENEAISMIKEARMQELRKDIPAKTQERKTYNMKAVAAAIAATIIISISIIMITSTGSEKCNILVRGDEKHYCEAIDTDTSIERSIRLCMNIEDEMLAAVCIDRVAQKSDTEINRDVCDIESEDLKKVCLAATELAEARKAMRSTSDTNCEKIQDSDIKTWCIAKNLESSALRESILKCGEIKDNDFRYLCRADKYRTLGGLEEYEMCQMISDRLYRFVCIN